MTLDTEWVPSLLSLQRFTAVAYLWTKVFFFLNKELNYYFQK